MAEAMTNVVQLYPEVSVRVSCRLHTVVPKSAEPRVSDQNERCVYFFRRNNNQSESFNSLEVWERKCETTRWTFDWILTKRIFAVLQEEGVGLTGRVESL